MISTYKMVIYEGYAWYDSAYENAQILQLWGLFPVDEYGELWFFRIQQLDLDLPDGPVLLLLWYLSIILLPIAPLGIQIKSDTIRQIPSWFPLLRTVQLISILQFLLHGVLRLIAWYLSKYNQTPFDSHCLGIPCIHIRIFTSYYWILWSINFILFFVLMLDTWQYRGSLHKNGYTISTIVKLYGTPEDYQNLRNIQRVKHPRSHFNAYVRWFLLLIISLIPGIALYYSNHIHRWLKSEFAFAHAYPPDMELQILSVSLFFVSIVTIFAFPLQLFTIQQPAKVFGVHLLISLSCIVFPFPFGIDVYILGLLVLGSIYVALVFVALRIRKRMYQHQRNANQESMRYSLRN